MFSTIENISSPPLAESMNNKILIQNQSWNQEYQTLSLSISPKYEKEVPLQIINAKNRLGLSMPPLKITFQNFRADSFSSN
jgi:hypothetical protein